MKMGFWVEILWDEKKIKVNSKWFEPQENKTKQQQPPHLLQILPQFYLLSLNDIMIHGKVLQNHVSECL